MALSEITVAAVIPLFNGAPFIREALESVIGQTEPPDEIIVVDDGSTDDGAAIVEAFAAEHPLAPIRLLRKPNGGQSSARNLGVRSCRSSHVAFLDQDDIWYDDHLQTLKQPFIAREMRDLGVVYGNVSEIDRSGRMLRWALLDELLVPHPKTSLRDCLSRDMFILPGASLVSVEAFNAVGGFDERLSGYEDDDLFLRIFVAGFTNVFVNKTVSKWRIYATSTSYTPVMARSRMIYYRKLVEAFPNEPALARYWVRDCIAPRFFRLCSIEYLARLRNGSPPEAVEQAWADVNETALGLKSSLRTRFRLAAPLVRLFQRWQMPVLARAVLRAAIHRRVRM